MRVSKSCVGWLFLLLIFGMPQYSGAATCPTNDGAVLNQLVGLVGGLLGWTINLLGCLLPPPGVTCDLRGCVVGLTLSSSQLSGVIPTEVGQLVNLLNLTITGTSYTSIPSNFANLTRLVHLNLANNNLSAGLNNLGTITSLPSLTTIDLSGNKFSGLFPIMGGSGGLPALTNLDLSGNKLTGLVGGGAFLSKSLSLVRVDLSGNLLTSLPTTLVSTVSNLNGLVTLLLSSNLISGLLLDLILLLSKLPLNIILDLSNNFICGLVPPLASRIIPANRLILNGNCFFNPLPNWCAVYSSSCAYMKPSAVCQPVIQNAYCPPVVAGNATLYAESIKADLEDGPQLRVVPFNSTNGASGNESVVLKPTGIFELDASNQPITLNSNTTQSIPAQIFKRYYVDNLDVSETQGFRISTILDNGAFWFWECYLSNNSFTKNFVTLNRAIGANTVTQNLEISYWPGVTGNTKGFALDFDIDLGHQLITYDNMSFPGQSFLYTFSGSNETQSSFLLGSAKNLFANVTLTNLAFGSNNQSQNITHVLKFNSSDWSVAKLRAILPYTFYPATYYDPDMGTLYGGPYYGGDGTAVSSSGGDGLTGGDGGGGWNNAYIAAIVVPVALIVLAVPAVVAVIVVILVIKKASIVAAMSSTSSVEGAVHI